MKSHLSLILAVMLLIACSGCWGDDRGGHGGGDGGGNKGMMGNDNRGDRDNHR